MPANSNRIIRFFILKEKQVSAQADCYLASAWSVENLQQIAVMKKWVKEGKKKITFYMIYYQY